MTGRGEVEEGERLALSRLLGVGHENPELRWRGIGVSGLHFAIKI